jgi:CRISPR-associated protein Cas1
MGWFGMTQPGQVFTIAALNAAWEDVRRTSEAAGVDGFSVEDFSRNDTGWLASLHVQLLGGRYTPSPLRTIFIAKRDGRQRRIGIPTVRDRIAGRVLAQRIERKMEPRFHPSSFAFRPGRSIRQAIRPIHPGEGQGTAVRFDIKECFNSIPCYALENTLRGLRFESWIIDWVRAVFEAGEMQGGIFSLPDRGISQGSPLSPVMCNIYLNGIDYYLADRCRTYVRYADDFLALVEGRKQADAVLNAARESLRCIGLSLNPDKAKVATFDEGFVFLGTHFVGGMQFPCIPIRKPNGRIIKVSGYEGDSQYANTVWRCL